MGKVFCRKGELILGLDVEAWVECCSTLKLNEVEAPEEEDFGTFCWGRTNFPPVTRTPLQKWVNP